MYKRQLTALVAEAGEELPADPDLDLRTARLKAEREVLDRALARGQGSLSAVARLLGISRPTLYSLLDTHGLGGLRTRAEEPPASGRRRPAAAENTP